MARVARVTNEAPSASAVPARLLAAITAVGSDLDLETVLAHIVEAGCALTDARYGALGVIGTDGTLERFVHFGMDDDTVAGIGGLPEGHGVLGEVIRDPRPLRLTDLGSHSAAVGFPCGHPPMKTFLGVPVSVRGEVYGNLYLAEKRHGAEFSADDEMLAVALTAAAGAAIANARLLAEAEESEEGIAATHGVATALLAGADVDDVLHLACLHARRLTHADLALVALIDPTGLVVHAADGDRVDEILGTAFPSSGSAPGRVFDSGAPEVSDDFAGRAAFGTPLQLFTSAPSATVVLWSEGRPGGTLTVARQKGLPGFSPSEMRLLQQFATQASIALDYGRGNLARRQLAVVEDEQRIAGQLNDSVIQPLFRAGLTLQAVRQGTVDKEMTQRIDAAIDDLDRGILALRACLFDSTTDLST